MAFPRSIPLIALCSALLLLTSGAQAEGLFNNGQGSSITFLKPPQKPGSNIGVLQIPDEVLSLVTDADAKAFLQAAEFNVTRTDPAQNVYHVTLSGESLPLSASAQAVAAELELPETLDLLDLEVDLALNKPWSRLAAQSKTLTLQTLDIKSLLLVWGDISLSATGKLALDSGGKYNGTLDMGISDWEKLLQFDFLNDAQRTSLQQVMGAIAKGSPDITLPVKVLKSRLMVGPIVVATIPPLQFP